MGGACSAYGRLPQAHTVFLWGDLSERDHLENLGINGGIILNGSARSGAWTGLIWLRIGSDGGHL